jgi:hypothetical protein
LWVLSDYDEKICTSIDGKSWSINPYIMPYTMCLPRRCWWNNPLWVGKNMN